MKTFNVPNFIMGFVVILNLLVPILQGNQVVHFILLTPKSILINYHLTKKFMSYFKIVRRFFLHIICKY